MLFPISQAMVVVVLAMSSINRQLYFFSIFVYDSLTISLTNMMSMNYGDLMGNEVECLTPAEWQQLVGKAIASEARIQFRQQ